jgi:hypothetical protein
MTGIRAVAVARSVPSDAVIWLSDAVGPFPLINPVAVTGIATLLELDQSICAEGTMLPITSCTTAESCRVPLRNTSGEAGTIFMVAGAPTTTLTEIDPLFPSVIAVIVAIPGVTPVTSPVFDTRATDSLLDDHV